MGQIIVVVPTPLNVVLEEDLVVMTAIVRVDTFVVMATVKTFIPQLLCLVVVVQVVVIPTQSVESWDRCYWRRSPVTPGVTGGLR